MAYDDAEFWECYAGLCNKHRRYAPIESYDIEELKDNEEIDTIEGRGGSVRGIRLVRTITQTIDIKEAAKEARGGK